MTDIDLRQSVADLANTVSQLNTAVINQADSSMSLATQVRESNERAQRDRKLLRAVAVLLLLVLALIFVAGIALQSVQDTQQAVEDCTTPQGKCAQRSQASTGQVILTLAYRGERERLLTELPISQAKGDGIRVDITTKRIAELDALIAASDKTLKDIQTGQVKPTTTLGAK